MFAALAAAFMVIGVGASQAGGTWFEPSWTRIEPGERVQLTATVYRGALGWVDDGPFLVYLQGDEFGNVIDEGYGGAATDVMLGTLDVDTAGRELAVSTEIVIPEDTPPGEYWITVCNDPCSIGLGDLIGGVFYVGIDPPPTEDEFTPSTTAATATGVAATTEPLTQRMALAPYPERPADMSPLWVGFSAAFAGAVLLMALLTRQRG